MVKQKLKFEKLISILNGSSDFMTAKDLSTQLQLSEKTIYRLIKEINQLYSPNELIARKKGSGFKLKKEFLTEELPETNDNVFTPFKRQEKILEKLLLISPKGLLIYDLGQEFYVSNSVIMKDKVEIQKQIDAFHLKISTQSGNIFIKGSELDIRRAIADLIPAFSTIDIDDLSLSTQSATFDIDLALFLLKEIKKVESHLNAELSYPYNVNIFSHLYIMIERLKKENRKASQSLVHFNDDNDTMLLGESRKVIKDISDYLGRTIDDIEISYLYQYLYSSRFQLNSQQQKVQFSKRVVAITKFYLTEMEMTKWQKIDEQSPMFIDLANHIGPLLRRLDIKIRIKNKMLNEICERYQTIYQQTEVVSQKMIQTFGFPTISADEIGFLTLYFVRFRELNHPPIKAIIMCSSGIGISELLKLKIEAEFKNLDIVEVVSSHNADAVLANHPDVKLLITSVNLSSNVAIKTVLVSALMTSEDKKNIETAIGELAYEN
ncbi:BglG family transcription antiterminator [Streptococcus mutans]|uniref:BglG family transcription antiterminator n=2 Tax=Streptococcus mutans TaxID=1309 RepID=UPI0002B53D8D|nr:PRD domain-containing protein [Streptococcus mutans]EMC30259.1 putative transcription antiterminator BglG family protein [Streptococcus mutans U2A]MCB5004952.1 PRD domain-containing protein [Streptococcus mutans]